MLTVPQASKLTGKHEDTIRRLIKQLLKSDPMAKDKIVQEKTVTGFHYLIDQEYLSTRVQPLQTPSGANGETASNQPRRQPLHKVDGQPLQISGQPTHAELRAKDETISILKKQLEQKDEQIRQLLERHRETNILLKGYQDRYLLEAPVTEVSDTNHNRKDQTEKQKEVKPTAKQPQKPKPKKVEQAKKKGFFSFLRGK